MYLPYSKWLIEHCTYLIIGSCGGAAQLVERQASNRKVAKTWFYYRFCVVSLRKTFNAVLGPIVVVPDEDCKQIVLCCSGMIDTEHNSPYARRLAHLFVKIRVLCWEHSEVTFRFSSQAATRYYQSSHSKEKASRLVPCPSCPRTQHANLPACSPHYPFKGVLNPNFRPLCFVLKKFYPGFRVVRPLKRKIFEIIFPISSLMTSYPESSRRQ